MKTYSAFCPLRIATLTLMLSLSPVIAVAEPDAALKDSLTSFFTRGVEFEGARAELIEVGGWPEAKGALHWQLPHISGHPGRISLVAWRGKPTQRQRWYVPVTLRWWKRVAVAKAGLPVSTILSPELLSVERRDITGHAGKIWSQPSRMKGLRLTQVVDAGAIISAQMVIRPPLLQYGDLVTLIVHMPGISVRASARVLQRASQGQRIRVQNITSKKIMQAEVMDRHTVRALTGGA
ncbi:MAG: hypothetical protein BMS9Abin18_1416 [Zetaproteobacteria bacterium]|nr:MAG: hypothetical protein BMS9Abin18_1416 [Zetaproteobacteria bacterium]